MFKGVCLKSNFRGMVSRASGATVDNDDSAGMRDMDVEQKPGSKDAAPAWSGKNRNDPQNNGPESAEAGGGPNGRGIRSPESVPKENFRMFSCPVLWTQHEWIFHPVDEYSENPPTSPHSALRS